MRYVTIAEIDSIIRWNLHKLPTGIDLIVGIPRSGMLPASIISPMINAKLTDLDSFIRGYVYNVGRSGVDIIDRPYKNVLVIDDSIQSGRSMIEAKNKIKEIAPTSTITYCAVFASSKSVVHVDIYFEIIDEERFFEWSFTRNHVLNNAFMDIDGVICVNPTKDDDGPIYSSFIANAHPLFLPQTHVNTIISCRLEKYREKTEEWLCRFNVDYNNLILLDLPDKKTRQAWGKPAQWKASYYKRSDASLFVESSDRQARVIAAITKKPVLCIETNALYESNTKRSLLRRVIRKTLRILKKIQCA